ncbi:uncharacterized protein AMSG_04659 [Thecamonas trahens ATCC 50062]|uniref:Rhodanese domain-containing protein n=1 Tax=Thecamonas trahens ATCC 50062 TaxID=461836 RepID=A0A0L0D994_THETB|nr:hypothetical protein AMSG_04659 [Thecamonas trahens ATCC 50062]KNC48914.1 hypothetical protein AMSG_04659 [Thecamonas trahens ATCC 50062]|eukprot:XP_013758331.1 hypothetical protein AMSG_04659 [Thecamonas trahens ATCC 50062]
MATPPTVPYLQPDSLLGLLRDEQAPVVVVDVRDDDHAGGHIAGAIWLASRDFDAGMTSLARELVQRAADAGASDMNPLPVVVHCQFSQVRGPSCARALAAHPDIAACPTVQIAILKGGYSYFSRRYAPTDPDLFADDETDDDSCSA